jgi:hypothetical protein
MTKKDYMLIAGAVADSVNFHCAKLSNPRYVAKHCYSEYQMAKKIANVLAVRLEHNNTKFDKAKFLEACNINLIEEA